MRQAADEIFEKLRGRFAQKRCPTLIAGTRQARAENPELKKCDCDDVIYTGSYSCAHTFNWSDVCVAKVGTKCINFNWQYKQEIDEKSDFCTYNEKGGATAKVIREQLKVIGSREGEFLAYSGDGKHFNTDHVTILGVAISRSIIRRALMYQEDQVFNVVTVKLNNDTTDYCPDIHFIGDKHHIVMKGQYLKEATKYELGCYPLLW